LPDARADGSPWPRISIVTPSYNQGQFIEETIRSILLQGYPDLEYLVIDGGSWDQSAEIIEKYSPFLAFWQSRPDRGQASAINEGLQRSTGEIFQWINSDDVLKLGALGCVASALAGHDAVAGGLTYFGDGDSRFEMNNRLTPCVMLLGNRGHRFLQPAVWLRREQMLKVGPLNERYRYLFDWEFMIRYLIGFPLVGYVDFDLVNFRLHRASKTVGESGQFHSDGARILLSFSDERYPRSIRAAAQRALRRLDWERKLASVRADARQPRWRRVLSTAANILLDPRVRLSRFSFGALIRIVRTR
jgi:glycosyltransferase involved in cell wall biosynthesis